MADTPSLPGTPPWKQGVGACIFKLLGVGLLVVGVLLAAATFIAHRRGADYLRDLEQRTRQEEAHEQAALVNRLAALEKAGRASLVEAEVSAPLLSRIFSELDGMAFDVPVGETRRVAVKLGKPQADFHDGFPAFKVSGTADLKDYPPVMIEARAVLNPELLPGEVVMDLRFLGLAPVGDYIPGWASVIASAEAVKAANAQLAAHPIRLPIESKVTVPVEIPPTIETPVKTDNGTIFIGIDLPPVPAITRWIQPREAFFGRDALHVLVELRSAPPTDPPARGGPSPEGLPAVTAAQLDAGLAPWRLEPGRDFSVRAGRDVLMGLIGDINAWTDAQRTVRMQGIREDGHIKDTTGGAPLGNGFSAYLDDARRLQGSVILREFEPTWDAANNQILLQLSATAGAQGQLHVHGHAPHIDPPKIFGVQIGGGATLGGGIGTSVGVSVDPLTSTLAGAFQLDPVNGSFQVQLLSPGELNFKVHAGGIPDALLNLFNVGFKVPLPCGKSFASFRVPALVATKVEIPSPESGAQAYQLSVNVKDLKAALEPESLHMTGKIELTP